MKIYLAILLLMNTYIYSFQISVSIISAEINIIVHIPLCSGAFYVNTHMHMDIYISVHIYLLTDISVLIYKKKAVIIYFYLL